MREFTAEDERRITIVLDTRDLNVDDAETFHARFEAGVVQAASLMKHFIDERAEVRLILHDDVGTYGTGLGHLYDSLRRLALVEPVLGGDLRVSARQGIKDNDPFAEDYAIVLTTAPPGSIPPQIWRASHVIYV